MHATGFCRRNALRLTLPVELPFRLCNIRKKLQNNVRDHHTGQVLALLCVEQRHIQNDDVHLLLLRQEPPLLQNFIVIAPKPVDALDHDGISGFELSQEPLIPRPLEVLAGLLIHVDVAGRYAILHHSDFLPVLVLIAGRYPDIRIFFCFHV